MSRTVRCLLPVFPWLFVASLAAQTSVIHTVFGDDIGEEFGYEVAAVGDVDGDGIPDFAVGAPEDRDLASRAGKVTVFSGADASVLHTFLSADAQSNFGRAIAGAGDVNGDGRADILVGKPWQIGGGLGKVYTYSGMDGSLLRDWSDGSGGAFGHAVENMGDLNADGIDEVLVSEHLGSVNSTGQVHIVDGATGGILHTMTGEAWYDQFGVAIGSGHDADGDGFNDVVVGVPGNGSNGAVYLFSGQTGLLIFKINAVPSDFFLGRSVAMIGDVNADGHSEFAASDGSGPGLVKVFSGLTGMLLYSVSGISGDNFGVALAALSDVNGDAVPDFACGATFDDDLGVVCGSVNVFSGVDGERLAIWYGFEGDRYLGSSIAGVGDLNGDGIPDLVAGASTPRPSNTKAGYARVYSGRCLGSVTPYGSGTTGSGGFEPLLDATGCPAPTGALTITIEEGLGGAPGLLFIGTSAASLPWAGGNLLVAPPFISISLALSGAAGLPGAGSRALYSALQDSTPAPVTIYLQAIFLDPAATAGLALTRGLEVEIR